MLKSVQEEVKLFYNNVVSPTIYDQPSEPTFKKSSRYPLPRKNKKG